MRRPLAPLLGLLFVLGVALVARLREPLSSPILGAEDPFLHMVQAWDLAQGRGLPAHYPPGFPALLAPFTFLGARAFYALARWGPPLLGVAEAGGVWLLARRHLGAWPALAGGLLVALMPENVFRTDLLFPTALDLALLPFLFLATLRAVEGSRAALAVAAGLGALLLVSHPWVVALLVLTLGTFTLGVLARRHRRRALPLAAATATGCAALVAALTFLPGTWNPTSALLRHAGPRLVSLVLHPSTLFPLPQYVDLPAMLTWGALVFAAAGALCVLAAPRPLGLLALTWTALLLPIVLVDWFGVWFIPHRTVAYLSVGVALLGAHAVERLMELAPPRLRAPTGALACALALGLVLPAGLAVQPWYRIVEPNDVQAWKDLDAKGARWTVTTSWQSAAGDRATTGRDVVFNPSFFTDAHARDAALAKHPDAVVLVDRHAKENGLPTGFLASWRKVGQWGDVTAYTR